METPGIRYFDAHAHYNDLRFEEEFEWGGRGALLKAHAEGVERICNVGSSVTSSEDSIRLAEEFPFVIAAVGIHPSDAQEIPASECDRALSRIEALCSHEKVRAVGEIGFDYHWDGTDKERQTYFFEAQMEIALRAGLPVVIHTRDAAGDTFDLIARHPENTGVLHSYSGHAEGARQYNRMGWYLSFSGPVTYKNANKVKESAAAAESRMLMIETDCPYLPPVPHRGEINYSGYLRHTCEAVAAVRGISPAEAAELTYQNAERFFGL